MHRFLAIAVLVLLGGCFNTDDSEIVRLGDVSLGQQLIDLKNALNADALSQAEYDAAKQALLAMSAGCEDED